MGRRNGGKKADALKVAAEKQAKSEGKKGSIPGQVKKVRYSWTEVLDPLTRVVALHPTRPIVAVAVGCIVRIHAYGAEEQASASVLGSCSTTGAGHSLALRVMAFSPDGQYLLTAADDKAVKIWAVAGWQCVAAWKSSKKVSAGCWTMDSQHVLFADKFGDVLCGSVKDAVTRGPSQPCVPPLLLGHYASIITSMTVSPDNRFLASTDKDYKVRVSILPSAPTKGAPEIQSYCLGHTAFVTSCKFISVPASSSSSSGSASPANLYLVTGSGDGSVRLWEPMSGRLLDTYIVSLPVVPTIELPLIDATAVADATADVDLAAASGAVAEGEEAGGEGGSEEQESGDEGGGSGEGEDGGGGGDGGGGQEGEDRVERGPECAPVLDVSCSPDGCTVAVVVEGSADVTLLTVDHTAEKLQLRQLLQLPSVPQPCCSLFDSSSRLWVLGGIKLLSSKAVHVGVAASTSAAVSSEAFVEETSSCFSPCSLESLECRAGDDGLVFVEGATVASYSSHLVRRRQKPDNIAMARKKIRRNETESDRLKIVREKEDAAIAQAALNIQAESAGPVKVE